MHKNKNREVLHTTLRIAIILIIISLLGFLSYFFVTVSQLDEKTSIFDYFFSKSAKAESLAGSPQETPSDTAINTAVSKPRVKNTTTNVHYVGNGGENEPDDSESEEDEEKSDEEIQNQGTSAPANSTVTQQSSGNNTASDSDSDGYLAQEDCDDSDPYANPGHREDEYNNIDDDCNPETRDAPSFWLGKILVFGHPQPNTAAAPRSFLGEVQYRLSSYTTSGGTTNLQTMLPTNSAGSRLKIIIGSNTYQILLDGSSYQRVEGQLETWQD